MIFPIEKFTKYGKVRGVKELEKGTEFTLVSWRDRDFRKTYFLRENDSSGELLEAVDKDFSYGR